MAPILPDRLVFPSAVLSGKGRVTALLEEAESFGERGVLVHGRSMQASGILDAVVRAASRNLRCYTWEKASGEPGTREVEDLRSYARKRQAQWIAALGGGSVLDAAKACAGLFRESGSIREHHEGKAISAAPLPFVAAPSTAGTGSEATGVSVLTRADEPSKKAVRSPSWIPRVVILDHGLLAHCPPRVIAWSGMDALTQAYESFVSQGATQLTRDLALRGLGLVGRNLFEVFRDPATESSEELLAGSFLTGVAFAHSRLGVVHGLAHPLGARYGVPHGQACAAILPHAIAFNRTATEAGYERMSRAVGEDLSAFVNGLLHKLAIENPFSGRWIADEADIVEEALASGSTRHNPRDVGREHVREMLRRLFTPEQP